MNRTIRIAGLLLASLTISTVALAQQGGDGGRGGGGGAGGAGGGGGDHSVIELRLRDHEKARLARAAADRRNPNDCLTYGCNPPPRRNGQATQPIERCDGDTILVRRNRSGRIVRHACENRWAGR